MVRRREKRGTASVVFELEGLIGCNLPVKYGGRAKVRISRTVLAEVATLVLPFPSSAAWHVPQMIIEN